MTECHMSAVDALASALMRARRARKREDVRYDGPDLGWRLLATCRSARFWWSHEGRARASEQGMSLLRVALMLAYQLGFEAGAQAARERRFPWHVHGDRRDETEPAKRIRDLIGIMPPEHVGAREWLEALACNIETQRDDDGPEDRLPATDGDAAARSAGTDAAPT